LILLCFHEICVGYMHSAGFIRCSAFVFSECLKRTAEFGSAKFNSRLSIECIRGKTKQTAMVWSERIMEYEIGAGLGRLGMSV